MARMVSFIVLVAILIVIGVLFFQVMAGFLLPLFMAALLGVVFQPLYRWTLRHCREQRYVASGVTTLIVLLMVLVPVGMVITLAAVQGVSLVDQLRVENIRGKLESLRQQMGLDVPQAGELNRINAVLNRWVAQQRAGQTAEVDREDVDKLLRRVEVIGAALREGMEASGSEVPAADIGPLREALVQIRDTGPRSLEQDDAIERAHVEFRLFKTDYLGGAFNAWAKELANPTDESIEQLKKSLLSSSESPILSFGGNTVEMAFKLLVGTLIMIAAMFFLFAESSRMLDAAIRLSPLEERYVRELVAEFDRVCRAVVAATLLSAVAQAALAAFGFYLVGLEGSVALLALLTMVLAMVPFTGAAAVWIPVCLYLYFYEGRLPAALILAFYGAFVVSLSDNLIKPWVLHGQSNLHPLLALLSVIGGIQALGPIGILVGPMVVVFLQTLLKILQRELLTMDRRATIAGAIWPGWGMGAVAPASAAGVEANDVSVAPGELDSLSPQQRDDGASPASGSAAKPKPPVPPNAGSGKKRRK